ncbi:hypothetical protein VaNZ11_007777 [Volvox africanus]|uniref:Uncharacterized protein n=1 Tax=Volvox africanus TaxID=51714 RepID=A0ABQ5S489_9CHLO|nr:hypothetical protein VaNZ11_007777 [Volvox africanus]
MGRRIRAVSSSSSSRQRAVVAFIAAAFLTCQLALSPSSVVADDEPSFDMSAALGPRGFNGAALEPSGSTLSVPVRGGFLSALLGRGGSAGFGSGAFRGRADSSLAGGSTTASVEGSDGELDNARSFQTGP